MAKDSNIPGFANLETAEALEQIAQAIRERTSANEQQEMKEGVNNQFYEG